MPELPTYLVTKVWELVFLAVPEAALDLVVGGPLELALTPVVLVTFIVLEVAPLRLLVDELLVSLNC